MVVVGAVMYLSGNYWVGHFSQQGASVNTITEEGVPVLSLAVNNGLGTSGCLRCIEALVQGGASLGAQAKW